MHPAIYFYIDYAWISQDLNWWEPLKQSLTTCYPQFCYVLLLHPMLKCWCLTHWKYIKQNNKMKGFNVGKHCILSRWQVTVNNILFSIKSQVNMNLKGVPKVWDHNYFHVVTQVWIEFNQMSLFVDNQTFPYILDCHFSKYDIAVTQLFF